MNYRCDNRIVSGRNCHYQVMFLSKLYETVIHVHYHI
jgi:hypothetical protein